ncbi:MAG: M48 family metallopeptidase [Acidobacteriia bacterium]|nr:M48 family metallopeptidase [Terriglobia bacterium]
MTTPTPETRPEQLVLALDSAAGLDAVFGRVFRRLGLKRPTPEFRVEYRPFASLRSTIRLCGSRAVVHLADVLTGAPPLVNEALAEILLAQLFRRRPSREARACYLAYVYSPAVRRRIDEARRTRGRKRLLPPRGRHYDLEEIFDRLNHRFFAGALARPRLGWSTQRARSTLGHYDSAHGAIIISRHFDSSEIPRFLVEYLMFHEMLHIQFPVERDGHRRVVHSRAFREAEKKFPHYERARRRLKGFSV